MKKELHILSLGAGVQSSTLALMASRGEVTPMPHCAIFADTQSEGSHIMKHLSWLEPQLAFPVHRVTKGSLYEDQVTFTKAAKGEDYIRNLIPAFTANPDGSKGMLLRKCTGDYKIAPIRQLTRKIYLENDKPQIFQWIGISLDEVIRMKPSGVNYITHVWPLIDKRMTRQNCLQWMEKNGYPEPPKSSCTFCPYHSDVQWREIKDKQPEDFKKACQFEKDWNEAVKKEKRPSQTRGEIFLHRSLVPLGQVDLQTETEKGQMSLWGEECAGICGV